MGVELLGVDKSAGAQGRRAGGGLENRCTVEAPISGHSWDAKIVSVTGAAPLTRMSKYKLKLV